MGLKSQEQETSQLIEWRAIMKRIVAFIILFSLICAPLCLTNVEAKTVKVTYKANGGIFKNKKKQKKVTCKKHKRGKAPTVKRSGYAFLGWYTKKKGGKKVSYITKIEKSVKVYAHWVKKYKINTNYTNLLSKTFLTLDDLEKCVGSFQYIQKWDEFEDTAIIKNKNGDIFKVKYNYSFDEPYEFVYIETEIKNILNIKKSTSAKRFIQKMGLKHENNNGYKTDHILIVLKGNCYFRISGTSIFAKQEHVPFDIGWTIEMPKSNKIKPSSIVKLELFS